MIISVMRIALLLSAPSVLHCRENTAADFGSITPAGNVDMGMMNDKEFANFVLWLAEGASTSAKFKEIVENYEDEE